MTNYILQYNFQLAVEIKDSELSFTAKLPKPGVGVLGKRGGGKATATESRRQPPGHRSLPPLLSLAGPSAPLLVEIVFCLWPGFFLLGEFFCGVFFVGLFFFSHFLPLIFQPRGHILLLSKIHRGNSQISICLGAFYLQAGRMASGSDSNKEPELQSPLTSSSFLRGPSLPITDDLCKKRTGGGPSDY